MVMFYFVIACGHRNYTGLWKAISLKPGVAQNIATCICASFAYCEEFLLNFYFWSIQLHFFTKFSPHIFLRYVWLQKDSHVIIIIIIYPLTARVFWGTTDDFTTSFLHFSLFSTALWDLAKSRPVHSLMLSSHFFLCVVPGNKTGNPAHLYKRCMFSSREPAKHEYIAPKQTCVFCCCCFFLDLTPTLTPPHSVTKLAVRASEVFCHPVFGQYRPAEPLKKMQLCRK